MANSIISFYKKNCLLSIRNFALSGCSLCAAEKEKLENKYLLVLDFEATCEKARKIEQEIIEFPCLKVNLKNFEEEARFHHFIKPVINPQLTKFCVELTGILQEVVDESMEFPQIYYLFEKWREEQGLTEKNSVYITSGDWDLGHMMPRQCTQCKLPVPPHMKEWIDIKKEKHILESVSEWKDSNPSLHLLLSACGSSFKRSIVPLSDDCMNMLQAIRKMGESNVEFSPTSVLVEDQKGKGFRVKGLNDCRWQ